MVLIGRWVDVYLMIFPETIGAAPVFGIWEAAAIACLVGLTLWLLLRRSESPIQSRAAIPTWTKACITTLADECCIRADASSIGRYAPVVAIRIACGGSCGSDGSCRNQYGLDR